VNKVVKVSLLRQLDDSPLRGVIQGKQRWLRGWKEECGLSYHRRQTKQILPSTQHREEHSQTFAERKHCTSDGEERKEESSEYVPLFDNSNQFKSQLYSAEAFDREVGPRLQVRLWTGRSCAVPRSSSHEASRFRKYDLHSRQHGRAELA
jgi:hypothetical protein